MAALEDYQLSEIRSEVAAEFGMDATNDATIINYKINQALQWIVRRRERWPWLEASTVLTVLPSVNVATLGSFVLGANTFGIDSQYTDIFGTGDPRRFYLEPGSIGGNLVGPGYLVSTLGADSNHLVLDGQFLEGTTAGSKYTFTVGRAFYALPSDMSRILSVHTSDDITRPLVYADPTVFEKYRRRFELLAVGSPLIYTVVPDPIGNSKETLWLGVYPVPSDRQNLHIQYYREVQNLTADTDVPVMPVKHRPVLTLAAFWFMAQKRKMDPQTIVFYRDQAVEAMISMLKEYDYSADPTENEVRKWGVPFEMELDLPIVE